MGDRGWARHAYLHFGVVCFYRTSKLCSIQAGVYGLQFVVYSNLSSIVTMYGLIFGRTIHHQKMLWVKKVKPAALVARTRLFISAN